MTIQNQDELRAHLERTREGLNGLTGELRSLDDALEQLAEERERHRLVGEACGALEVLAERGGAALFWAERRDDGATLLRLARDRVDGFRKRVRELEERREALLDEIAVHEQSFLLAEDDVLELERQEEQRKLEWVVEREIDPSPTRQVVMPWSHGGADEQRFRRALATALFASALLGAVMPLIPLPQPERQAMIEVPERLARLLQDQRPLPPPAPVRPVEQRDEQAPPREEEPRVADAAAPKPSTEPGPGVGPADGPAQGADPKGILAFREQLSGLARGSPGARLGLEARISTTAEAASGAPERSLVTTMAAGSNAGVQLASMSRWGGGGGSGGRLADVAVTRATSTIGGGGGGRGGGASSGAGSGAGLLAGRTDEEIQIVFDRHKAELYRLYNRELRSDPTLRGQILLRMRIEPDGSVSLCALQATDMNAPQLAAQVVDRVRGFDFGAKEGIAAVTILYPIEFLPAT